MAVMTFEEVVTSLKKKHRIMSLLMGNGFSMAYDKEIFSYNALYNFLQSQNDELLTKLFGAIKTKNFELVMQQLDTTIALLDAFGAEESIKQQILEASVAWPAARRVVPFQGRRYRRHEPCAESCRRQAP